ncbi:MAG: nuclear transport factor 2 family protein [Chloroflexi bacterium]|nr:nuclear transport factor 2 family protein [Chloroflexota bacterium]
MTETPKERHNELVSLVEQYVKALNSLNESDYVALFAENAVVNDPFGTAEYLGEEGLRRFFKGMTDTWRYFEMRGDKFYPGDGNRVAVRWSVSATAKNGKTIEFSGVSIFYFAKDKISGLDAYWHFRSVMKQLRD